MENDFFTILWWFLPCIDMNHLKLHMCLTILNYPPASYSTSLSWVGPEHWIECLSSCITLALVICFSHMEIYISMLFSQITPPFLLPAAAAATAKSLQSCATPCNTIDGNTPGSPIPEILQARTLEWVAIFFSNAWKWKLKVKSLSPIWLFGTSSFAAYQAPLSMGFSRQEYWSGLPFPSPFLLSHSPKVCCLHLCLFCCIA